MGVFIFKTFASSIIDYKGIGFCDQFRIFVSKHWPLSSQEQMISVKTPRLELLPLDPTALQLWHQSGRAALEKHLHLKPNTWELELFYQQETQQALRDFWIPQTKRFPLQFCWYTSWEIILTSESCSIGGIGFAGLPNDHHQTEVGYCLDAKFRGNGYASEALEHLCAWAFQDQDLWSIRAETPQDNLGSQAVLKRNGFKKMGEKTLNISPAMDLFLWEKVR